MRRPLSFLAVAALAAVAALVGVTGPAAAAPLMRFHGAQYDAPGADTRTNSHLNQEWISLVNTSASPIQLRGWKIRDKAGHVFTFGTTTIAARGGRVWLHTGKGTATPGHRYWGSGNYIWNNTGDTATLINAAGRTHDTCSWGQKSGRTWVGC
jgi:hypothetical protein